MTLLEQLEQSPKGIQYRYEANGLLFLTASCFSWRFVPNLLLLPLFSILGMACFTTGSNNWFADIFSIVLGVAFFGVALLNLRDTFIYLWGRVEWKFSQQGGQVQWLLGGFSFGKAKVFYWQDLTEIYLGEPKRPENDKDVLIVLKGKQTITIDRFLNYKQLVYCTTLLQQLLAAQQQGNLALAEDWEAHLID